VAVVAATDDFALVWATGDAATTDDVAEADVAVEEWFEESFDASLVWFAFASLRQSFSVTCVWTLFEIVTVLSKRSAIFLVIVAFISKQVGSRVTFSVSWIIMAIFTPLHLASSWA